MAASASPDAYRCRCGAGRHRVRAQQPGFDDAIGQPPADADHQQAGGAHEEPVAQRVNQEPGGHHPPGLLRDALQQRVQGRGDEVGGKATGDPRKGGRDAGQRMAAGGMEDGRRQRDHHHVARVRSGMAEDCHQHHQRRQPAPCGDAEQPAQAGIDQAEMLGNPHSQQCHQHDAERRERRKGRDQLSQETGELDTAEQIDDGDGRPGLGMDSGKLDRRQHSRQAPDRHQQQRKQRRRIRQAVADGLDCRQHATGRSWRCTGCATRHRRHRRRRFQDCGGWVAAGGSSTSWPSRTGMRSPGRWLMRTWPSCSPSR